jgi:O-antigen/teichoic acid export membrane protein
MTAAIDAVPGRPAGIDSADPPNAGRAARGAAWLGLGAVVVKGAQTVVLLVLAALLAPSALGLIAIGTVITNIAQALSDLGTNIALTYWRGDARRAARTALTITLVMNVLIAAVVWLAAPWLAQALHASADGTWVIRGLVSVLPFYGAAASSLELLRRDLAFARRILPDIVAAVVGAAVSIGLAVEGHGVAGLVAGQIVQGVLTLLLVWVVGEVIVPGWNRGDARGLLSYGGHLTAASLLQLALLNVDYLIVARVLGGTPLGQYSLAFRLAYLPYLNVAFVIAGAAFPYLCRLPENAVGRALQRVVADAMTLLIPLCLGIALFADQLELLGTKWHPAVAAVRWLALYGALLSAAQFVQTAFNSIGRPRTTMQLQLLHFVVLVPILVLVVHHGVTAVAVGQCLAVIVEVAVALGLARVHLAGLRLRQLAADLGPALLGAVCMTAVVLAVHHVLPATTVSVEGLAWVGVLGLGAYLTPVWLLGRANVVRLARLIARSS